MTDLRSGATFFPCITNDDGDIARPVLLTPLFFDVSSPGIVEDMTEFGWLGGSRRGIASS